MELEYIYSATVVVREGNTKILCDPWLVDGIYYGSWYMYPKLEGFDYKSLDDITAIYISHIHADHCDEKTMSKLPRVPVFIHKFDTPFLKSKIERMGFEVRELQNGHSCQIGDLSLTIFAADNCDPSACYKFFGCSQLANKPTSTSIDSLCVISNGRRHILNTNDCPYSLSVAAVKKSLERFKNFDLIMTGYSGAGSYPQCWLDCYDSKKVKTVGEKKKEYFIVFFILFITSFNLFLSSGIKIISAPEAIPDSNAKYPDSLPITSTIKILDLLCEGPIEGFAEPLEGKLSPSIFISTPSLSNISWIILKYLVPAFLISI